MTERRGFALILACGVSVVGCSTAKSLPIASPRSAASNVSASAVADVAEVSKARALSSRVTKVTVYSDRARVTREATTKVTTAPTVFAFKKLPGWVDDGSVRVAASTARIVDVRVERSFLARATDKTWQRAKARHQDLTNQLMELQDELAILEAQKKQIEGIKAFSLAKINDGALLGKIKVNSYGEVLAFISKSLRATAKARRAIQHKRDKVTPELQASKRTLDEMKNLMKLEETTVLVTLQSSRDVTSDVELTYMLPGATWQPMHELRASTATSTSAKVVSYAVVTQTSGEDWRNARLSFSTQSSTQSVRIPELEALTLGDTHTATRILTNKMSSFSRAEKAFRQQSRAWNKVQQKAHLRMNFDKVFQRNIDYLQVVQNKTVRIFQSLQKRGTTAHFKAAIASRVRGDGHPVRIRIGDSTLQTNQKIVAVPEQSLNAARTLQMTNATGQSLLPGKVALYQDGAFLGLTEIDFIARGERFALFLSVADHIKLSRKLDRKYSTLVRKRRNKMRVAFIVTVENLSSKATTLALADRIPVSENKEIKIDQVKITDAVKPDSRGLLHWKLKLQPQQKRQFRIAYRVEYPPSLVLETRRNRLRRPARPSNVRSSPVMRKKYQIKEQLTDLEALL